MAEALRIVVIISDPAWAEADGDEYAQAQAERSRLLRIGLLEAGYNLEANNWWGLLAPTGTSPAWIEQLHQDVNAVLSSAEMKQRLANEGAETSPMTRAEFAKLMSDDMQRWSQIARATGIRAD